jgi:hypothetical protein
MACSNNSLKAIKIETKMELTGKKRLLKRATCTRRWGLPPCGRRAPFPGIFVVGQRDAVRPSAGTSWGLLRYASRTQTVGPSSEAIQYMNCEFKGEITL